LEAALDATVLALQPGRGNHQTRLMKPTYVTISISKYRSAGSVFCL